MRDPRYESLRREPLEIADIVDVELDAIASRARHWRVDRADELQDVAEKQLQM